MWDNIRDCRNQLQGTIVRRRGVAVKVLQVYTDMDGCMAAEYVLLSKKRHFYCKVRDLDLSPVPLGYVNTEPFACYSMRSPCRRWKHGIDERNIVLIGGGGFPLVQRTQRALSKTIEGKFPTFEKAVDAVSNGATHTCAFNRNFAVSTATLSYKGREVGRLEGKEVFLHPKYTYLNEQLTEAIKC